MNAPHLPYPTTIDAYGKGGFRFGNFSHRGSLLCLPSGIWAWPVARPQDIDEVALAPVFAVANEVGLVLLGTGREGWAMPPELCAQFARRALAVEVSRTSSAVSTYNILFGEGRRVAAALIAVS